MLFKKLRLTMIHILRIVAPKLGPRQHPQQAKGWQDPFNHGAMPFNKNLRAACALALQVALVVCLTTAHLAAQGTTATVLGTVTDSSGAAIPDAMVRVTNSGTTATQTVMSDAQGRYRVPDLLVGEYEVEGQKTGFRVTVRKGITLSIGAEVVVDIALTVGQVTQTVTVEGAVPQVETTSSAVSTLIEPTQLRELPLNGRSFEQLILLSPGVTIHQAIGYQLTNGMANAYSVSGSRTRGQWEMLDDNNIVNWQGRGAGAGVLGTQLGIDAISEFQVLTNTYSPQYGGNGAVMNSVTRSGTNSFHGSGYEFVRNSKLDARNFFDPPTIPPFQKNQFGATIGGPIKKDKMFFFANYEGIRQNAGLNYTFIIPDAPAHSGYVPIPANASPANPNGYTCVNSPSNPATAYVSSGANNAACLATVDPRIRALMSNFPLPTQSPVTSFNAIANSAGFLNGLGNANETVASPGSENYFLGRYDWTISSKDSLFASYVHDKGGLLQPFSGAVLGGNAPLGSAANGVSLNQYLSIEEKHVFSASLINSTRFGFTRTLNQGAGAAGLPVYNYGDPNLWTSNGISSSLFPAGPQGSINILPLVSPNITLAQLGSAIAFRQLQNKFSGGEDIAWNRGAHSLQFGMVLTRVQSYGLSPTSPGAWTFSSMQTFLTLQPTINTAVCDPTLWANCASLPTVNQIKNFQETDFGFYVNDTFKLRSNLTVNIGLRYEPNTMPHAVGVTREWSNFPLSPSYNPLLPMPGCLLPGNPLTPGFLDPATMQPKLLNGAANPAQTACPVALTPGTLPTTPTSNVYLTNSSFKNFEPRGGLAWDPFSDHKTSVRVGWGMYDSEVLPYDYTSGPGLAPLPYQSVTTSCAGAAALAACQATFPVAPFSGSAPASTPQFAGSGIDMGGVRSTPYMIQYNLTVQREITRNTTLSVGYVGSHGVHLIGYVDQNPQLPDGVPGALTVCASGCNLKPGQIVMPYPAVGGLFASAPGLCGTLAGNVPNPACGTLINGEAPASANGKAIVDPTTGQSAYSNVVFTPSGTGGSYSVVQNNRYDRTIIQAPMRQTTYWSHYNALEVAVVRRLTNNLQAQFSYTWGSCISNSGGTSGFENAEQVTNPYDANQDRGNCPFLIRHDLSLNGMYIFPFKRNLLVSGWQLGGIFIYHTGTPIDFVTGWPAGIVGATSGPISVRPDVVSGCKVFVGKVNGWYNPDCFTMNPIGEPGNVGAFDGAFGPGATNLDMSLVKNTKIARISDQFNVQLRFEVFNVANHTQLRSPAQPGSFLFGQSSAGSSTTTGLPPTCFSNPSACSTTNTTAPLIFGTNGSARQIQLGVKIVF
jgi:Carboxypeptidase regulatory-like domain